MEVKPEVMTEASRMFNADLNELRQLVEAGNCVNVLDSEGYSLLTYTIRTQQVEIFEYLLSLDQTDVNFANLWQDTPLINASKLCHNEYFARRLIEKGADMNCVDYHGLPLLSCFAFFALDNDDRLCVGQLAIEKGADINQQDKSGMTPLHYACKGGNFDWVCMLLFYRADVTIATNDGILPLVSVSPDMPNDERILVEEMFINYTLEVVRLPTLVEVMTFDSELFQKMFNKISDIDYDLLDLRFMADKLLYIKLKHLKLFMTKFSHIVQEIIDDFSPLVKMIEAARSDWRLHEMQDIINFFLDSDYAPGFVQNSAPGTPVMAELTLIYYSEYKIPSIYEEDFTKMICLMLSYGLTVTTSDLKCVYYYFDYCELFEILLHMDIEMANHNDGYVYYVQPTAAMYYDPHFTVDRFFDRCLIYPVLLHYFNDRRLNKLITDDPPDDETLKRVKKLPQIPLLVELSRNVARKYIVDRFNVKKSVQF